MHVRNEVDKIKENKMERKLDQKKKKIKINKGLMEKRQSKAQREGQQNNIF